MKKFKLLIAALFCVVPVASNATLVLNIDDDGGFARFSMSGSDVASSGTSGGVNGFWLFGPQALSMFNTPLDQSFDITSGGGSLGVNGGSFAMFDVFMGSGRVGCCHFGLRTLGISAFGAGDTLEMSGVFTTNLSFSVFNSGIYDFSALTANVGDNVVLRDGFRIQIGPNDIPEPGSLMLLGLVAFGMSMERRRRAR
ncbi:MAG: PEP-CTERM sorting domain-containing protein [Gammaproteobacteria bacterium]